jgi:hypothetical protein
MSDEKTEATVEQPRERKERHTDNEAPWTSEQLHTVDFSFSFEDIIDQWHATPSEVNTIINHWNTDNFDITMNDHGDLGAEFNQHHTGTEQPTRVYDVIHVDNGTDVEYEIHGHRANRAQVRRHQFATHVRNAIETGNLGEHDLRFYQWCQEQLELQPTPVPARQNLMETVTTNQDLALDNPQQQGLVEGSGQPQQRNTLPLSHLRDPVDYGVPEVVD